MKNSIILFIITALVFLFACSNIIDETIFDKDLERGKYNSSQWGKAKFK